MKKKKKVQYIILEYTNIVTKVLLSDQQINKIKILWLVSFSFLFFFFSSLWLVSFMLFVIWAIIDY